MSFLSKFNSFVVGKVLKLSESIASSEARNITRHRVRTASIETGRFVEEYMYNTPAYESRYSLISAALKKSELNGLYLEFGVFQGKTINWIAGQVPDKTIYGFDSFEGLPEDWRHDFVKGSFAMDALPAVEGNVKLVKGWFNESIPPFLKDCEGSCSFIHIDCDLYSSTKTVFDLLGDRITTGTVIVFDEFFNYPGWKQGEFKAFMEFCASRKITVDYLGYCYKDEQVAIRVGPAT